MRLSNILYGALATLTAAQTPAPYTDAKSGITFSYFSQSTGYFFGLALPENSTGATDFIATIGGKGTGWSGVSLGGPMLNKLLIPAWANGQEVVGSFRKTAQYGSPAVATGSFTQTPIANGSYVNSTHWTYTFLCAKCIQTDGTTFKASDTAPSLGWAMNANAPAQRSNPASSVTKHSSQGQVVFDLAKARNKDFAVWAGYATKKGGTRRFEA